MAVSLLDVNVLIALSWPNHIHHEPAHKWFGAHHREGWATCPITQLAFVRLCSEPSAVRSSISVASAMEALADNVSVADHEFWALDYDINEMLPEIRSRLVGHRQLTDALLLDLAIRRGGKLVTFDRRTSTLLACESEYRGNLHVIEWA